MEVREMRGAENARNDGWGGIWKVYGGVAQAARYVIRFFVGRYLNVI